MAASMENCINNTQNDSIEHISYQQQRQQHFLHLSQTGSKIENSVNNPGNVKAPSSSSSCMPKIPSYQSVQDIDFVEFIPPTDISALSKVVGSILNKLCTKSVYDNYGIGSSNQLYRGFSKENLPKITLQDYCTRILKFGKISIATLVQSVIYIDKIITQHPKLLTIKTVHRLLLASIIVSAKFTDDYHLTNTNFARVGGVNLKELNMLEVDFCKLLSFSLFTPVAIFNKYWKTIHSLAENIEDDEEE